MLLVLEFSQDPFDIFNSHFSSSISLCLLALFHGSSTTMASSPMDKQGRKSLLVTRFAGMAASVLLLSISFSWNVLSPYSGTLAVIGRDCSVCVVLLSWCWSGPCSITPGDIFLPN